MCGSIREMVATMALAGAHVNALSHTSPLSHLLRKSAKYNEFRGPQNKVARSKPTVYAESDFSKYRLQP